MKFAFDIKGMHCKSCAMLIREELEDAGATDVKVTVDEGRKAGTASGESELPLTELAARIEALGDYKVRRS